MPGVELVFHFVPKVSDIYVSKCALSKRYLQEGEEPLRNMHPRVFAYTCEAFPSVETKQGRLSVKVRMNYFRSKGGEGSDNQVVREGAR